MLVLFLVPLIWGAESCCLQREVEGTDDKAGNYTLLGPDARCGDACLYEKEGDSRRFCFQDGDYDIICNSTQASVPWTEKSNCLVTMGGWDKTSSKLTSHFNIITSAGAGEFETCQLVDVDAVEWKGSLPGKRHSMITAVSNSTQDIIICGGQDDNNDATTNCWSSKNYLTSWSWTALSPMPEKNYAPGYASVDNILYVFGGIKDDNSFHKTIQKYNMDTDTWTTSAVKMTGERAYHCAVAFKNYIILTGGDNNGTKGEGESIPTVEVFNTLTDEWWIMEPLNNHRKMHGCGLVKLDGEVGILVAGGGQWPSVTNVFGEEGKSKTTEFLSLEGDFIENKWVAKPDMKYARAGTPAIGYIDNEIVVFGGSNSGDGGAMGTFDVWRNSKWEYYNTITEEFGSLGDLFWRTVLSVPCGTADSIPIIQGKSCQDLYDLYDSG